MCTDKPFMINNNIPGEKNHGDFNMASSEDNILFIYLNIGKYVKCVFWSYNNS